MKQPDAESQNSDTMSLFLPLKSELEKYFNTDQINPIYKAFTYAEQAHRGQTRRSGEPYITHPVAVGVILAQMRMDKETIMAAILHDVLEDTPVDKHTINQEFGEQVAELVDGVSKLTQMSFESRAEAQAENFQKMVSAMARDIRVILIKLSDRLHNMRTLAVLDQKKRHRIAQETLEIYAPIANRLGMNQFRIEFEELGFAAMHPMRFRILNAAVKYADSDRRKNILGIEASLANCMKQLEIPYLKILGREKHLYSIYKKMRNKHVPLSQVVDLYMFRIIVPSIDTCYRVLGAVHNLYKPVPERFKDYIAIPKINGYQALHTTLFGPYGTPIEILIRSQEMDQIAEHGIASHWAFKSNTGPDAQQRAREWLKSLLEMQRNTGNSLEFIENVKIDLFPDEVYVFTPKGAIMELPRGATPVDFAYAVHSDVGNACVAAKVDRQLAPLSSPLKSGQTVEVITAPKARPNPAWLNFVVTGKARSNIRHYLKKQRHDEATALGQRLLEGALSVPFKKIPTENIKDVLEKYQFTGLEDLFESIGLGNQIAYIVAEQLINPELASATPIKIDQPIAIKGSEDMVVQFAECCRPIPGDDIRGLVTAGKGLMIHEAHCRNIRSLLNSNKLISVCWEEAIDGEFKVDLEVALANYRGALAELATLFSQAETNIDNIHVINRQGDFHTVAVTIAVLNRLHLANILRRARRVKSVQKIMRKKNDH
jgi:RelA/SpoT family (p)ppGpp synthetase